MEVGEKMRDIVFEKLMVKNTLSFKDLTLYLSNLGFVAIKGINLDDGGSNGSGKSTIPKLLFYALTGSTPDGKKADSMLSDFNPKDSYVRLDFYIGDVAYFIKRYRKHTKYSNNLTLNENGQDITRKNAVDTQKKIYDIFGMSKEGLLLLLLLSTNTVKFADSTPTERRRLFTQLFPVLNVYEKVYAPKFTELREVKQKEVDKMNIALIVSNNREEVLQGEKESIKTRLKNEDITIKRVALEDEYKQLATDCKQIKNSKKEVLDKIDIILKPKKVKGTSELFSKIRKQHREGNKRLIVLRKDCQMDSMEEKSITIKQTTLKTELATTRTAAAKLKRSIKLGKCPTCGAAFTETNLPVTIKQTMKELEQSEKEQLTELTTLEKATSSFMESHTKNTEDVVKLEKRMEKQQEFVILLDLLDDKNHLIETLETQSMMIEGKIENLQDKTSDLQEQIEEKDEQIATVIKLRIDIDAKIKELELDIKMLSYLKQISTKDIPTYLLNSYLTILEEESSNILSELFTGMKISIKDTALTKTGIEKPELNLMIENNLGVTKDYLELSGGERQAVDISLVFGIQRLTEQKAGRHSNLLFLDEIIDLSSDEIRSHSTLDFLVGEKHCYDSMLLISHKPGLSECVDSIMEVTKKNGISTCT